MTTFTVTSDAASTTRTTPISGRSPQQSRQNQSFGGNSTTFRTLTPQQKAGWQAAANVLNTAQGRTGRHRMSAANAFKMCAAGRTAVGLPVQLDAPTGAALSMPPGLPNVLVNATNSEGTGQFKVTLTPQTAVANPVLIFCAPPQIAGKVTWPDGSFAPIGHLNTMTAAPNDISAMVAAKYGPTEAGMELALRLVVISDAGLRRSYLCVTGFCAGITAEGAGTADTENTGELHVA